MKNMNFASLHNHTYFSLLDCAISPESLVEQAHEFGYDAVAISDHGNMHSFVRGYKKAKELGIKYIAAIEAYETTDIYYKEKESDRYHLILLAKSDVGLKNLFKIVTESNTEGFYGKPRISKDTLKKYSEDIIVMSACLGGMINKTLGWKKDEITTELRWNTAKRLVQEYKDIVEDRFYIELQSHDTEEQARANKQLVKLARETNTKFTITFDTHIKSGSKIDRDVHALFVQTSRKGDMGDDDAYQELLDTYKDCWAQSLEEIHAKMDKQIGVDAVNEGIRNTYELSQGCSIDIPMGKTLMPHIQIPDKFNSELDYLKHLINVGWKRRGFHKFDKDKQKVYANRLHEEIEVINYLGYNGYFLMLAQLFDKFRERKIPLGYGRGSAGGCLILYCLGVTEIDSIKWDLDFSRFANKGRVGSPADVDVDISKRRRSESIEIASELFGADHICQLATFNSMSPKVCIRDLGKALDENGTYELPYSLRDKISKLIPNDPSGKMTIDRALENSADLRKYEKQFPLLFEYTRHLQNVPKSVGTHAAAVLIMPEPCVNYFPLQYNKDGNLMSQLEMHNAMEDIGGLKCDFLGLNTLDLVDDTLSFSNLTWDDINLSTLDLDNRPVFEHVYKTGDTAGIFQMETYTPQRMFQDMGENINIHDIFAVNALNRPALLSTGMDRVFLHNKRHNEDISYIHPDLESIFGETYSVMLYQEQALKTFKLAGFPDDETDLARRAIGHKEPEVMKSLYKKFEDGLLKRGWNEEQVNAIWRLIEAQSSYSFNSSHSTAYGLLSYVTAYLKYHHPKEFMTALLISETGNYDQLTKYISECRKMNIPVLPPDINVSNKDFTVGENGILFGLLGIKGVGDSAVETILSERENGSFTDLQDFVKRTKVDVATTVALIHSGAFGTDKDNLLHQFCDILFERKEYKPIVTVPSKKILLENDIIRTDDDFKNKEMCLELWNEHKNTLHEKTQNDKYLKHVGEFKQKYMSSPELYEFSTLSIFLSNNPFDGYEEYFKLPEEVEDKKKVLIGGVITKIQNKKQRDGQQFAYIDVLTPQGIVECVLFAKQYSEFRDLIFKGSKIVSLCKTSSSQYTIEKVKEFDQWKQERTLTTKENVS